MNEMFLAARNAAMESDAEKAQRFAQEDLHQARWQVVWAALVRFARANHRVTTPSASRRGPSSSVPRPTHSAMPMQGLREACRAVPAGDLEAIVLDAAARGLVILSVDTPDPRGVILDEQGIRLADGRRVVAVGLAR